jgi:hypothetical protein
MLFTWKPPSERMVAYPSEAATSSFGLDSETIVDGRRNPLGATEVTLSSLHRGMAKKKLNLSSVHHEPTTASAGRRIGDVILAGQMTAGDRR